MLNLGLAATAGCGAILWRLNAASKKKQSAAESLNRSVHLLQKPAEKIQEGSLVFCCFADLKEAVLQKQGKKTLRPVDMMLGTHWNYDKRIAALALRDALQPGRINQKISCGLLYSTGEGAQTVVPILAIVKPIYMDVGYEERMIATDLGPLSALFGTGVIVLPLRSLMVHFDMGVSLSDLTVDDVVTATNRYYATQNGPEKNTYQMVAMSFVLFVSALFVIASFFDPTS